MSYTTTCDLYFTDIKDNVFSVFHPKNIKCDSTYTTCTISTNLGALKATCDSKLHEAPWLETNYYSYFCACNGRQVSIPAHVGCDSRCYNLNTPFSKCNVLDLYDGAASGSPSVAVIGDACKKYMCDPTGTNCTSGTTSGTTSDTGSPVFVCDNTAYDSAGSATHSYACNCHGAATIPQIYRAADGKTQGTACGNAGVVTQSASASAGIASGTSSPASSSGINSPSSSSGINSPSSSSGTNNPSATETKASGQGRITASFANVLLFCLTASILLRY